jgi:hypothetical protein
VIARGARTRQLAVAPTRVLDLADGSLGSFGTPVALEVRAPPALSVPAVPLHESLDNQYELSSMDRQSLTCGLRSYGVMNALAVCSARSWRIELGGP